MLDQMSEVTGPTTDLTSAWGKPLIPAICENCDWAYLLLPGLLPALCPHCCRVSLVEVKEPGDGLPYSRPPELLLPFSASDQQVAENIRQFASNIWFAPSDLSPRNLGLRLQRIFLPMWLVDSELQAIWQAEAGFNYEAISHRDSFDQNKGGWVSARITETRIRWEPRLGRLQRSYMNVVAPALEEHFELQRKLGAYDLKDGRPYQATAINEAFIRLPNRPPADAWPDAKPAFQNQAVEECRRACQGDHLRDFRWKPEYYNQNWTLLLLPMYATHYLDDDQTPQPLLIHGRLGQVSGPRRASMKRAKKVSFYILAAAVTLFFLSLIIALISRSVPPLYLAAVLGLVIAIVLGLAGLVPIFFAWQFNRSR